MIFTRGEGDEEDTVIRETIPIVIIRFTGHKDQMGKKIFDGDILRLSDREKVYIEWNHEKCIFDVKNWDSHTTEDSIAWLSTVATVRGNVFENLEEFSPEFKKLCSQWRSGKTSWQKKDYAAIVKGGIVSA